MSEIIDAQTGEIVQPEPNEENALAIAAEKSSAIAVPDAGRAKDIIQRAQETARAVHDVISKTNMFIEFSDRKGNKHRHLTVDAWELIARFDGLVPTVIKSELIKHVGKDGQEYEAARARVALIRADTREEIAYADAMCSREETRWAKADTFSLLSMAQTRAIGKVGRNMYAFVVKLAGYNATPVEEMTPEMLSGGPDAPPASSRAAAGGYKGRNPNAPCTPAQINAISKLAHTLGRKSAEVVSEKCIQHEIPEADWEKLKAGDEAAMREFPRWIASELIDELIKEKDRQADGGGKAAQQPAEAPSETARMSPKVRKLCAILGGAGYATQADKLRFVQENLAPDATFEALVDEEIDFLVNRAKAAAGIDPLADMPETPF